MSWLTLAGLVLMLLGIIFPTLWITSKAGKSLLRLGIRVALGLFYLICGLILFFQSWRFNPSDMEIFVITALTLTNIYWVIEDIKRK